MQTIDSAFSVPPFPAFPSTSRYIAVGSLQEAVERVCRSVDAREGIGMVVGPPGTGKSLLCGLLVERYRDSHDVVVLGETPLESSAAFLRHLLHHLGENFQTIPDGDLQLALIDRVTTSDGPRDGLLIVVDEAQALPAEVLESIRMVTNIMRDGEPRVFAVLCGGNKLEDALVDTSMEGFTQRISTRCYLHAFNSEETAAYIRGTIQQCGSDPDATISADAIAAVHHACMGIPRLINQLMTEAIDCAAEAESAVIGSDVVDRAWAQLQQLPSPIVDEPAVAAYEVEFGELSAPASSEGATVSPEPANPEPANPEPANPEPAPEPASVSPEPATEAPGQAPTLETEGGESARETAADGPLEELDYPAEEFICQPESSMLTAALGDYITNAEPADQPQPVVEAPPTPIDETAIFGDFDSEEEISLGRGVSQRTSNDGSHDAGSEDSDAVGGEAFQPPPEIAAPDLESVLHQEVIGISAVASEGLGDAKPIESDQELEPIALAEDSFATLHDEVQGDFPEEELGPSAIVEFPGAAAMELPSEAEPPAAPAVWLHETEELELPGDDSDLLVIEDEVELTVRAPKKNVDSRENTISVDFQAMLARMRSGT